MLSYIFIKFFRFGPVLYSPVFKIPFFGIFVALVIDIVNLSVLNYEISGKIIYIEFVFIKHCAHFAYLV